MFRKLMQMAFVEFKNNHFIISNPTLLMLNSAKMSFFFNYKSTNYLFFIFIPAVTVAQSNHKVDQNCIIANDTKKNKINNQNMNSQQKNVFGDHLEIASSNPLTGFYRNGFCSTGDDDHGIHVVAAVMTEQFLNYSKSMGNDLITPNLNYGFPGLKPGDIWCLCAKRYKEALGKGVAPPVLLKSTNTKTLNYISLDELKLNAVK